MTQETLFIADKTVLMHKLTFGFESFTSPKSTEVFLLPEFSLVAGEGGTPVLSMQE